MAADAFTRRNQLGEEMKALAEEHLKHDLRQSDRDALRSAASTLGTFTPIGSAIGLSLGVFFAYRLRANRAAMFRAFKVHEQPTAIQFIDGRVEPLPDLTRLVKPSRVGTVATYSLLGLAGLLFGGQTGMLLGSVRARQQIGADRESRERIEKAFNRFRADVLRKQADELDDRKIPSLGI